MDKQEIMVAITASVQGLAEGLQQAGRIVADAVGGIDKEIGSLEGQNPGAAMAGDFAVLQNAIKANEAQLVKLNQRLVQLYAQKAQGNQTTALRDEIKTTEKEVEKLTAEISRLQSAAAGAASGAGPKRGLIQSLLGLEQGMSIEAVVGKITSVFAGLAAVIGGGHMFKGAVDETIKWNAEAWKLSRVLGIATEQASILNLALGDIYTDSDTYIRATQMLTRQLNSGGDAFEKLGVETKNAAGHLRPTNDIMEDVLATLNRMKAGTDRNVAGMSIFGRSWGEASKLMLLTAAVMEEAKDKAERLHLIVGPEGVAKMKAYKAALNDTEDVMTSLKVEVGSQVMPNLSKLGQWFGNIGPGLAMVLKAALNGITTAFYVLKFAIEWVVSWIGQFFAKTYTSFTTLGSVITKTLKGDFSGAAQAAKDGGRELLQIEQDYALVRQQLWEGLQQDMGEIWDGLPEPKKAGPDAPDGDTFDPGKDKADAPEGRVPAWKAELEGLKALEENWFSWSVSRELQFWQQKLALVKQGDKEYGAVQGEVNKLRKEKLKEEHDAVLEGLRAQMDVARASGDERIRLQEQVVAEEVRIHGKGTKDVIAAERELNRIRAEIRQEDLQAAASAAAVGRDLKLAVLDQEAADLEFMRQAGQMNADEELQWAIDLEMRKLEVKREAFAAELAAAQENAQKMAEVKGREALTVQEHENRIRQIQQQTALEHRQSIQEMFQPLTSAMEQNIQSMLAGTTRLSDGVRGIMRGLGNAVDQMITRMVMSWLTGERTKTVATQVGVMQRLAAETWGAIKSVALAIWTGLKWIAVKAYEAAAGAYSAISSIPYVGPFLAPVVAAGTIVAVLALGSKLASAAGGWDMVPNDQIAQIHKGEMVMSAPLAEGIRDIVRNGQTGGGGRGGDTYHFHAQMLDGRGAEDFLRRNQGPLVRVMKDAMQNRRNG